MKKRYSAEKLLKYSGRALAALLFCAFTLTGLSSCRTTAGTDHDQIVRTSIDLAQAYSASGQYASALEVYDRALLEADDYRLYYNKAIILSDLGRNGDAAELCNTSYERYPEIIAFKEAEAIYLNRSGDEDAAQTVYMQILDLNPYDRASRTELIKSLISRKKTDEAYSQALILWNQGYRDKETVTFLYELRPETWENTYKLITGK